MGGAQVVVGDRRVLDGGRLAYSMSSSVAWSPTQSETCRSRGAGHADALSSSGPSNHGVGSLANGSPSRSW